MNAFKIQQCKSENGKNRKERIKYQAGVRQRRPAKAEIATPKICLLSLTQPQFFFVAKTVFGLIETTDRELSVTRTSR